MSRSLTAIALLAVLVLHGTSALAQADGASGNATDASPSAQEQLQQSFGIFGGFPLNGFNVSSGASAPAITIGSGSSSSGGNTMPGSIFSLFGIPAASASQPGDSGGASGAATSSFESLFVTSGGLFPSLFGPLPTGSVNAPSGDSPVGGGLSQTLNSQSLNMAQSFSSSFQNILAPQSSGQQGAGLQTSTQNNLTTLQPVTALQGSASSVNATTNNGFILSISGFSFNFGD